MKELDVIFMSNKTTWPKELPAEEWLEIREHFHEFKGLMGKQFPGSYILVGNKVVGGVSSYLARDPVSKRKILDALRAAGYEPHINEHSPF